MGVDGKTDPVTNTLMVKQRYPRDCFLCCMAMAARLDYDTALAKWSPAWIELVGQTGLWGTSAIREAFEEIGMRDQVDWSYMMIRPSSLTQTIFTGHRAIFQVPSLNEPGGSHAVFWDRNRIVDPSCLLTYKTEDRVTPDNVWYIHG